MKKNLKNKITKVIAGMMPVSYTHLDVYKRQGFWERPVLRKQTLRFQKTMSIGF